jgi:hypothetical protein
MTEDRGQKSEDGGQKSVDRRQKSEDRVWKWEVGMRPPARRGHRGLRPEGKSGKFRFRTPNSEFALSSIFFPSNYSKQ